MMDRPAGGRKALAVAAIASSHPPAWLVYWTDPTPRHASIGPAEGTRGDG
jgi:hypothetical protein